MKKVTISIDQAIVFEKLLIENRDSKKLQKTTDFGYIPTVGLINELRKKLNR